MGKWSTAAVSLGLAISPTAAQLPGAPAGSSTRAASAAPVQPVLPTDPATLAAARRVVARLIPVGVYRQVMSSAMDPVMGSMGESLKAVPLRQLAQMGGLDAQQAAAIDKIDVERVMAIYDPHWQERLQLSMRAMVDAMGEFFTTQEPGLREAMAQAYAHSFSLQELRDLDAFFATPSGSKFAGRYMTIMNDPAMAAEMRAIMPKMMQQMPQFVAAAQRATAKLPPPRKLETLTPAEKAELAKALGVDESKLHDPAGIS